MNAWLVLDHHKSSVLKRWAIPLGIFVLALIVRIPALGKFITPDEPLWLDSSKSFAGGLLFADYECGPIPRPVGRDFVTNGLGCTFNLHHPGVTTMWAGSLGSLVYYWQAVQPTGVDVRTFLQPIDVGSLDPALIASARIPLVIVSALFVSLFYVLLRRLLGERAALISTLLLALHPFHIAHSRVLHNDALTTTFMVLSLLTMVGYWLQGWKQRWLLVSGVMAGLAILSKQVSWFMIPYAGVMGGVSLYYRRQSGQWRGWFDVWRLVGDGILWGMVAGLTFVALYPAMWVMPGTVIHKSISDTIQLLQEGHTHYFLGQVSSDPGPLFYPVGWLLRASPLEVLGLLTLSVAAWRSLRPRSLLSLRQRMDSQPVLVTLMLFLVTFLLFATSSDKKMVRYFLPAFPVIDVFAALGLMKLEQIASRRWREASLSKLRTNFRGLKARHIPEIDLGHLLLVASIILVQAVLAWSHYPYYLTYYNPLLGGAHVAQRLVMVGWGEGLELAAAYLNQKPNADQLKVNVWLGQSFAPYFHGKTIPFFSIGRAMSCDYLVFYQGHLQRQSPSPELQAYYLRHYTPEHIVHLKGIDYALIYAVPVERRTNWQLTNVFDKLILYGYRQLPRPDRFPKPVRSLAVQIIWENKGMSAEDGLWAALQHCERGAHPLLCSEAIVWQPCALAPGFSPEEAQELGTLIESVCELNTRDLAPGVYSLHVGLGPSPDSQVSGYRPGPEDMIDLLAPHGELGISIPGVGTPSLIPPDEALDALAIEVLPPESLPLHVSYGDMVALIGYQVTPPSPQTNPAGMLTYHTTTVTLYWQALQDIPQPGGMAQDFQARFDLIAPDGTLVSETTSSLLSLAQANDVWQAGEVLADPHQISLPDNLPPGEYHLAIALTRADTGELVPLRDEASGLLITDHVQLETTIAVP